MAHFRHRAFPFTLRPGAFRHDRGINGDLAFLSSRGLGIRILLDGPPDEAEATELRSLIERLRQPPAQHDLILDVGLVVDPLASGETALITLDMLAPPIPWRTVVLAAGAFPRTFEDHRTQPFRVLARHDWQLYEPVGRDRLRRSRPPTETCSRSPVVTDPPDDDDRPHDRTAARPAGRCPS
ncbi:beta family protein [Streptomyces platensis]|uniref:beta family protein n=1 Tax=Streptomyces platensis TaxID=58346 RepID=UPI00386F2E21